MYYNPTGKTKTPSNQPTLSSELLITDYHVSQPAPTSNLDYPTTDTRSVIQCTLSQPTHPDHSSAQQSPPIPCHLPAQDHTLEVSYSSNEMPFICPDEISHVETKDHHSLLTQQEFHSSMSPNNEEIQLGSDQIKDENDQISSTCASDDNPVHSAQVPTNEDNPIDNIDTIGSTEIQVTTTISKDQRNKHGQVSFPSYLDDVKILSLLIILIVMKNTSAMLAAATCHHMRSMRRTTQTVAIVMIQIH